MRDDDFGATGIEPHTNLEAWPSFSEHSLLEAAVAEAAREFQVPREMALMCAFGAMATACQQHVDVQLPTGHKVPTSLMLLTIAESGERKTTTQGYFFEAINHLNDDAHRSAEAASMEQRVSHQLWSTRKRHLERMYSKHASQDDDAAAQAALAAIAEHVRAEPQNNRSGKFLYEDTTLKPLCKCFMRTLQMVVYLLVKPTAFSAERRWESSTS